MAESSFAIRLNDSGYPMISNAGPYKVRRGGSKSRDALLLHHAVVRDELGITSIPSGYHIHHCDRNRLNCSFDNLILISEDDHKAIHQRIREEGRNIPKEELLADSRYNTDHRTFGLSFGDYDALLHKGLP